MLPEKWKIKRNTTNHKKINNWFGEGLRDHRFYTSDSGWMAFPNTYNGKGFRKGHHNSSPGRYEEITFEQFQAELLSPKIPNYEIF